MREIISATFVVDGVEFKPVRLPYMEVNESASNMVKSFRSIRLTTHDGKPSIYSVSVYISRKMNSEERTSIKKMTLSSEENPND